MDRITTIDLTIDYYIHSRNQWIIPTNDVSVTFEKGELLSSLPAGVRARDPATVG